MAVTPLVLPFQFSTAGLAENSKVGADFDALIKYVNSFPSGLIAASTLGHIPYYTGTGSSLGPFAFGTANQILGMNNAASSIEWKSLPFVNVVDYGADPTGVADSATAFTNAYAAISTTGGTMVIPRGTFKVTTSLKPVGNTTITGVGRNATVINYTGTGFWLDNTDSGPSSQLYFTVQDMAATITNGKGFARIGDPLVAVFSENNQHIFYTFRNLNVDGNSSSIVANSHCLQLSTFYKCSITGCNFRYFSVGLNLYKFDEGYVYLNTLSQNNTYCVYVHNDMTGSGAQVCDETTFIDNSFGIPLSNTVSVYLYQLENIRFISTYIESTASVSNTAFKFNTVYNCTIDGGTIGSVDIFFDLTDSRTVTIRNIGMQNMEQSPVAVSSVSFKYGSSTDLNGNGGPFQKPFYGTIAIENCAYQIAYSFKGFPEVSIISNAKYGPGKSLFGGMLSDVSHLYATQVLERNGLTGLLKEPSLVVSPFSGNSAFAGIATTAIVADATASTGYALKIPGSVSGTLLLQYVYPADILPGAYEIVARIRHGSAVTSAFFAVYYDSALKESFAGIDTTTSYKIVNARFNFSPAGSTNLQIRIDSSQDLYVDYIILRPCFNSLAFQTFVDSDYDKVGTNTTPGYRITYSTAAPVSGTWAVGDIRINTAAAVSGFAGWYCTTAGTPGTWTKFGYLSNTAPASSTLTSAHLFVGNGSNVATDVAVTGDIGIDNAGLTSISTGVIVNTDINASAAIALSKLAALGTAKALQSNSSTGVIEVSSVTNTELSYLSGVTSAIQTQLGLLAPLASPTFTGTVTAATLDAQTLLKGKGTATNDSAAAGYIGEEITTGDLSATATTGAWTNASTLSLTAGHWVVYGSMDFAGTTATRCIVALSANSGATTTDQVSGTNMAEAHLPTAAINATATINPWTVQLSGSATYYFKYFVGGSGSPTYKGRATARRVR